MTVLACAQPQCAGAIEDGYCNVCGVAPVPGAVRRSAGQDGARIDEDGGTASSELSGRPSGGTMPSRQTADSRRGQLGAGLVDIPPIRASDPAGAVMADPQVPESRRFCSNCGQPVGRGSAGTP